MSRGARGLMAVSLLVVVLALVHGDPSRSPSGPDPTTPAGARPGPPGPVGPDARSCTGVRIGTGDDIQAVVDDHPPGTTFCLAAGTHRVEYPVVPRRGDALIGSPGAVLSGAKVLTRWHRDGLAWSAHGYLPPTPDDHGACRATVPTCAWAEDVFVDGRRLRRVATRAAVTAGTVHADYRTDTITIGDDPRHRLLEQAVAPGLVRATVDDVTVADLVLEKAANEAQVGAVETRGAGGSTKAGSGWRIIDNEVRLNHGVGIGFGDDTLVSGNDVHHQGQLGLGAWGRGSLVTGNEIASNGTAGYSADWESGGVKLWGTTRTTLTHNDVHDNTGPGLWADGGAMDTTYAWNRVADNWGAGIQHEISYDARIVHNVVVGNGLRHKGWAWDAGIQVQSSGGTGTIEIAHNRLRDNANAITLIDSGHRTWDTPRPHGPHLVRHVRVHDNSVTMRAGQTAGAVEDTGDRWIFTSGGNRFEGNAYHLDSLAGTHFSWAGDDVDWEAWRRLGLDVGGSAGVLGPAVTADVPPRP